MQLLAIIATLDSGESTEYKGNVRAEAMGLSGLITKYSSVFLMLFVQKLLDNIFVLSNYLQRKDIDIAFAKQLIDVGRNNFVEMRSDEAFEILNVDVKSFISENCSKLDVKTEFKEKRIAKKKSMAGELSRDKMADDPTTLFKSETYFTIMDTLVTQINDRFNDFWSTVTYFYCIDTPQKSEENKDYFQSLCKIY